MADVGLLFLAALVIRIGFVLTLDPNGLYWSDEREFDRIAAGLAQGRGYVSEPHRTNPALPAVLAATYRVFGRSYTAARIVQAFFGAGTCVLVYWIARQCSGGRVAGLAAGCGAALYPGLIYVAGVFYAANLLAFFMTLGLALLCLALRKGVAPMTRAPHPGPLPGGEGVTHAEHPDATRPGPLPGAEGDGRAAAPTSRAGARCAWAFGAGAAWGLAVLTRPMAVTFIPVAAALVALQGRRRSGACAGHPSGWIPACVFIMAAALPVAPWCIRNYLTFHRFTFVAAGGAKALWMGNNPLSRGDADDRYLDIGGDVWRRRLAQSPAGTRERIEQEYARFARRIQRLDRIDQDAAYLRQAVRHIRQAPVRAAARTLRKVGTLYTAYTRTRTGAGERTQSLRHLAAALSFYPILALGLVGTALSWSNPRLLPVWLLIVTYTVSYAPLTACTRFRMPIDPCWIVLAGIGVARLWQRRRPRANKSSHATRT